VAGLLLVGWFGLVSARGALPAAWAKDNPGNSKGDTKGKVETPPLNSEETLISPDDLLFIQVFDVDQMTREYRVSAEGTLTIPLLAEPVPVAGLTAQKAAEAISRRCIEAGVLSHPQISVTIRESRVHAVAITGSVKTPQIFPLFGRMSLQDILVQAGGLSEDAGSSVTVTRGEISRRVLAAKAGAPVGEGNSIPVPQTVNIDLRRLLEVGDPSLNVDVYPGDRVTVQRAGVVYVLGAVNRSGGFLLTEARQDMTVLKALALAEYLRSTAKAKKTLLLHPNPSAPGGREEIAINLSDMLKGRVPDRPLHENDILFVPDSTALKALHASAQIAATDIGWAAIYH
jgi:polysaccharide export outer membrane protein